MFEITTVSNDARGASCCGTSNTDRSRNSSGDRPRQRGEKEEPQRGKAPKLRDLQSSALSGGFDGGTGVCHCAMSNTRISLISSGPFKPQAACRDPAQPSAPVSVTSCSSGSSLTDGSGLCALVAIQATRTCKNLNLPRYSVGAGVRVGADCSASIEIYWLTFVSRRASCPKAFSSTTSSYSFKPLRMASSAAWT